MNSPLPSLEQARASDRLAHRLPERNGRAKVLADLAVEALIAEAMLTPKPALVDMRGPGAHRDLSLQRMLASARALRPCFAEMAAAASDAHPSQELRETLARIGRRGEVIMMTATEGSNTHRGAIWSLGLLVSACSILVPGAKEAAVTATAAHIARLQDRHAPFQRRPGAETCARYRVRGAVGEAVSGFPHILSVGLPALRSARLAGVSEPHARLDALLSIMSSLIDTCLLWRAGWSALELAQRGARRVLELGGTGTRAGFTALAHLEKSLLALNASPGGSADLLAGCLFLDGFCQIGGQAE